MSYTPPPAAPPASPAIPNRRTDAQDAFDLKTDAWLNWTAGFHTWLSGLAAWLAGSFQEALASMEGNKNAAQSAAAAANTSAQNAAVVAGAAKWVAGNYAQGACVWSPLSLLTYRRIPAGTTASATDPASDPTGWKLTGSPYSMPQQELSTAGPHQLVVGMHYIILHPTAECLMPASAAPQEQLRITNKSGATTPILRRNGGKLDNVADDLQLDILQADAVFTMTANRGWI